MQAHGQEPSVATVRQLGEQAGVQVRAEALGIHVLQFAQLALAAYRDQSRFNTGGQRTRRASTGLAERGGGGEEGAMHLREAMTSLSSW